jgi:2-polyprenyl-6-methoxyphenol hydroxylase-like FAD-dependent oxidoreductase
MKNRKILISGAGIAGPCLAYWLLQHGFEPVLVERAPHLRTGGYVIDFWGLGFDVAEKMGLLPRSGRKAMTSASSASSMSVARRPAVLARGRSRPSSVIVI